VGDQGELALVGMVVKEGGHDGKMGASSTRLMRYEDMLSLR
jgi:hypothetical protein